MVTDTRYVRGAERLKMRLDRIRDRLDINEVVAEVGELLLKRTDRRFDTETDPDGKKWRALKDSTLRRKRADGILGGKILRRSGLLRESIGAIRGGSGSTFVNTGASLRIGVQDPEIAQYARLHQQGLGLPVRRFLGVGANDVRAVDNLLRRKARELDI